MVAKRGYKTQRAVDEGRTHIKAMCKALNEKTRIEIALIKYLESKDVPADVTRAALESVKSAQTDIHFKPLWDLLDNPYDA